MIHYWVTEKYSDQQFLNSGIQTFVSDPLGIVAPPFSGSFSDLFITTNTEKTIDYSGYFVGATSYSISPAVETGWTFNTSTGVLTILQSDVGQFGPYTITGTNVGGSTNSNAFYVNARAGSVGGSYGKQSFEYDEEVKRLLALEQKTKTKKKQLKKKQKSLKAKTRQKDETRLKLLEVSKSLLTIEKDLAEIEKKRAKIKKRARIMKDDEDVIAILMQKGYF